MTHALSSEFYKIKFIKDSKTIYHIDRKLKKNNVIISRADKGNIVVLLYENDYNREINDFIENNQIVKKEGDRTINYKSTINKAINKCTVLLS